MGRKAARRGHCARRRVSERNRRTVAALSAEIEPSLRTTGRQVVIGGKNRLFPAGCRGRIVASSADYPLGCVVGVAAAGGIYAAPTEYP